MTHEYVIAYNGIVEPAGDAPATAVGWAADAVLAVGSDDAVRAISRGDSTFIDLDGCVITPLPTDLERAQEAVAAEQGGGVGVGSVLVTAGLLEAGTTLGPGSPADLALWDRSAGTTRLVAAVRGGHFTAGDAHRGPFVQHAGDASVEER